MAALPHPPLVFRCLVLFVFDAFCFGRPSTCSGPIFGCCFAPFFQVVSFFLLPARRDIFLLPRHDLFEERVGFGGKLAALANYGAVGVEEEGERDAGEGKEGRDGAGPVDAEVCVHLGGEEGEGGTEEGAQDRVGGEDGGGEDGVGVDEVVHHGEEDEDLVGMEVLANTVFLAVGKAALAIPKPNGAPAMMLTIQWMEG